MKVLLFFRRSLRSSLATRHHRSHKNTYRKYSVFFSFWVNPWGGGVVAPKGILFYALNNIHPSIKYNTSTRVGDLAAVLLQLAIIVCVAVVLLRHVVRVVAFEILGVLIHPTRVDLTTCGGIVK